MTSHLLLIAIGPVQEFIAQARRTRDLWFGSHLLSELSRHVAKSLADEGAKLIFPALRLEVQEEAAELEPCLTPLRPAPHNKARKPPLNIANKILAEVPTRLDPEELARKARDNMQEFWAGLASDIKSDRQGLLADDINPVWNEQIAGFLEYFAAWSPIEESNEGYTKARTAVEKAVAARKNLRDFEPWQEKRDWAPKSSLDGARVSVLADPEHRNKELVRKYRIADGEQLDAVGLVKRTGGEPDQFVPLVNIALASWIDATNDAWPDDFKTFRSACHGLPDLPRVDRKDLPCAKTFGFDASIFLQNRWWPLFEEQGLLKPNDNGLDEDAKKKAWQQKVADWGKKNVAPLLSQMSEPYPYQMSEPYPYVACLVADGDGMGTAIDDLKTAEEHQSFSRKLSEFSTKARKIIEQDHKGSLVYSGGDDVLGFLPLPEALACAETLRNDFAQIMDAALPKGMKRPTLSVGIAIGHVMEGMGDLLELGRKAEKLAKSADLKSQGLDRNALALIVDKRSGGTRQWRARWDEWGGNPVKRLDDDIGLLEKRLATRKVYEIARMLAGLPKADMFVSVTTPTPGDRQQDAEFCQILIMDEVARSLSRTGDGAGLRPQEVDLLFPDDGDYKTSHKIVSDWIDRILIGQVFRRGQPKIKTKHDREAA